MELVNVILNATILVAWVEQGVVKGLVEQWILGRFRIVVESRV